MKVLLKDNVAHLGKQGDVVEVKPGYARNFLVPRGTAMVVTRKNHRSISKEIEIQKRRQERLVVITQDFAKKIFEAKCTVAHQADENDKLYGSVTTADIAKSLKLMEIEIDPKNIVISEPIKSIGVHDVRVKLDAGIEAELKVWVVKE